LFYGKLLPAETKNIILIVDIFFKNMKQFFVDKLPLSLKPSNRRISGPVD